MPQVPTKLVYMHDGRAVVIDAADFDPSKHSEAAPAEATSAPEPEAEEPESKPAKRKR